MRGATAQDCANSFARDRSSLYEHLGSGFTVLVTNTGSAAGLLRAAREIGMPVVELRLEDPDLLPLYEAEVLLVRPDHHVAWRGKAPESKADAMRIVRLALGW